MSAPRLSVPPTLAGVLGAAAATLAVAGCGGEDKPKVTPLSPQAQVRVIVRTFGLASASKDYKTICDRLISRQLSDNVEELGLPCEKAFSKGLDAVRGATLRIDSVRVVRGKTAYVRVHSTAVGQPASDDTLRLDYLRASWRITSLSAADDPNAAKPPVKKTTSTVPPGAIPTP